MDIIESYLYETTRRIPSKQRLDIEKELRSLIMDNLDDITGGEREPNQEDVKAVLKELGSPAEVAGKYRSDKRYIIGPMFYDTYLLVVLIVLCATAFGLLVSNTVSVFQQNMDFNQAYLSYLTTLLNMVPALAASFGYVTIAFIIIDRTVKKPMNIDFGEGGEWNPDKLPKAPEKTERIKPGESIVEIIFTVLALVLFNVFLNKTGVLYVNDGRTIVIPFLSKEAVQTYLPLWNIGWALSLSLACWLLAEGRWRLRTHIADIVITMYGIAVLSYMIKGPALLDVGFFNSVADLDDVFNIFNIMLPIAFGFGILGSVIKIIKKVVLLVRSGGERGNS